MITVITETYKGRKLKVRKSKDWGYLETYVNGQLLGRPVGTTREAMARELASLRGWVDAADERRLTDPEAYDASWYVGAPEVSS